MSETPTYAPIAIFAYDRLDDFEKMFSALKLCSGFDKSPITIFLDGPKDEAAKPRVEKVRQCARAIDLANVSLVEREANMGLKASIYDGVSKICKEHGRVIVLEDDLVVSPCVLEYFNQGLEKYKEEKRVWSIVGYQYDAPGLRGYDKALVLPFAHCWGWATWDRAWEQFDINAKIYERDLKSRAFRKFFDLDGVQTFADMLGLAKQGKINSWFIRWYYKVFNEGGVSIFPPVSYVENVGLKGGGTHSSYLNPYRLLMSPSELSKALVHFPEELDVDYWAIDKIRVSKDARVQKMIAVLGKIKRIIKGK